MLVFDYCVLIEIESIKQALSSKLRYLLNSPSHIEEKNEKWAESFSLKL